ncbi:MAG: hypothetical protein QOJ12_439 [Thermoleophilales bacterium]|nr:hypothetical protein [Thermoleophilales bacterium]
MTDYAARALLLRGQRLTEPERSDGASVPDVVRAMVGIQAQERGAGALGIRARLAGSSLSSVTRAVDDGAIIRLWSMRGTLHYVAADDARWLMDLLGPVALARARTRLAGLGVDGEDAVRVVRDVLAAASEPLTRHEIADAARARGFSFSDDPQGPVHLVMRAVLAGEVVEVGWRGGKPVHALWEGRGRSAADRDVLLAELARRYVAAYAPAGPKDLATWSGLGVTEARRAFELIASEVEPVEVLDRADSFRRPKDSAGERFLGVRLLAAWDNLLLCHRDRDLVVAPDVPATAVANGGILRPTLAVDGQIKGIWRLLRGKPVIDPFQPLAPDVAAAAEAEAADVVRFRST